MDSHQQQAQHEALVRLTGEDVTTDTSTRAARRRGLLRYLATEFKRVTRSSSTPRDSRNGDRT